MVRKQHLSAVVQTIAPPSGAVEKHRYWSNQMIARSFYIEYEYNKPAIEVIEYYGKALAELRYSIEKEDGNTIIAKKNGVVVSITYENDKLLLRYAFDDFFERRAI